MAAPLSPWDQLDTIKHRDEGEAAGDPLARIPLAAERAVSFDTTTLGGDPTLPKQ